MDRNISPGFGYKRESRTKRRKKNNKKSGLSYFNVLMYGP